MCKAMMDYMSLFEILGLFNLFGGTLPNIRIIMVLGSKT